MLHTLALQYSTAVIMSHDYKVTLDCAKCSVTHFSTIWGDEMPDHYSGLETGIYSE